LEEFVFEVREDDDCVESFSFCWLFSSLVFLQLALNKLLRFVVVVGGGGWWWWWW
jgi:hypothetical protein